MIQNKDDEKLCVSRSEGDYFKYSGITTVYNCFDAISMGDAREVFVLDFKHQILSFMD